VEEDSAVFGFAGFVDRLLATESGGEKTYHGQDE
jgi:hypothetical protein